jgi:hypothetical protein
VANRASRLASTIAADILRDAPEPPDLDHCFLCKRAFTPGKGFGINGRFCSRLCLDAYDAGYVHRESKPTYKFPVRGDGFLIPCRNCKREFVSKGLRCCSPACERAYCESIEIEKITAEVGMESTGYVKRRCEHCGNPLPRYAGEGKKRKQSTKRFCSSRCQQAAKKQAGITPAKADSQDPIQSVSDPSEVPVPQGVESRVRVPLDLVGGGSFRFSDASLDRSPRLAILDQELPPLKTPPR